MWIYIVTLLLVRDVPIRCPNGLDGCRVSHVRKDTTIFREYKYCERDAATESYSNEEYVLLEVSWNMKKWIKYNDVKLDSIFVEKK